MRKRFGQYGLGEVRVFLLYERHLRVFACSFIYEPFQLTMHKICKRCGKEKEHHAKGLCYACYRNIAWEPPKGICKRCRREMKIHAKKLCNGCYNFIFRLDYTKAHNYKKRYNIDVEGYKKITEQ